MLVLEIKTKNFFLYFWRGTRTLVPQPFFGVFFWCHFKTALFCNGSERRTILTGFQWISVLSIFSGFIRARTFIKRKTPTKLGHQGFGAHVPELWCPFEMAYRFFVSTNMGFRNRSLSFFHIYLGILDFSGQALLPLTTLPKMNVLAPPPLNGKSANFTQQG